MTLCEWSDTLVRDDPLPGLIDLARIAGKLGRNLGRARLLRPSPR